jgi:heat shock protein HtpX
MFPASLNNLLAQFLQPYFYYSVILLILSFICIKMLLRHNSLLGRRARSIMYMFPLIIPVLVMAVSRPQTMLQIVDETSTARIMISSISGSSANASPIPIVFNSLQGVSILPPLPPIILNLLPGTIDVLSLTGILCLIGLVLAVSFLFFAIGLDDKIVGRVFHVIPLAREEYSSLQSKVDEISRKLAVRPPRIGLVEDLRPNAFIAGCGSKTILVFSVGILNILDEDELIAVAAHELCHVKKHDFFFKTFSHALTIVSFFNPFAYFAASAAQREREMLADENGARLLGKPSVLARALTKTCKALQAFPKQGLTVRLTSSLFLVSPITRRPEILATHPRMNQRIYNITRLTAKTTKAYRSRVLTAALSLLIILGALIASYPVVKIQTSFMQNQPRLISIEVPVESQNFGLVLALEEVRTQQDELVLLSVPASRLAYKLIDFDDGSVMTMILRNDSNMRGLAQDRIAPDNSRAEAEFVSTGFIRLTTDANTESYDNSVSHCPIFPLSSRIGFCGFFLDSTEAMKLVIGLLSTEPRILNNTIIVFISEPSAVDRGNTFRDCCSYIRI